MSSGEDLPFEVAYEVRGCLCLHLQRAARAVARRFDQAFRPLDLTSGQFSLLTALDRMDLPSIGRLSSALAMDRTTLTANLKPLERRGLVAAATDPIDRRTRRLLLTARGQAVLKAAFPLWRATHAAIDHLVADCATDRLRADLLALS
jgi:DNA-binding MarR family transcriptional regulator